MAIMEPAKRVRRARRHVTDELRAGAVRLVLDEGKPVTRVARDLDGLGGLYLEDLFVLPEERGRGAGKALLRALAKIAVARGCGRMEWTVLDWNTPSIRFYKGLGARLRKEWVLTRLTGPALRRLGRGAL
jgi:GNAT superfamily N-acetyltransferase